MNKEFDVKKIKKDVRGLLKKTKVGFKKISEETAVFAKRGEKELSKIAKFGKAEMDILNLNIRKSQLYYQLGQKVYNLSVQKKLTTKNLKKLCEKITGIEKDLKSKKRSAVKYFKKK